MTTPELPSSTQAGRSSLALALLAGLVWQASQYGRALQDDTFISFVYARNLARGEGLVYNAGEPAVEGYTNFLWTVITAGGMRLGLDPLALVQLLGIALALLTALGAAALARRLGAGALFASGAAWILVTRRAFTLEAVGGLETLLFTALATAAVLPRWSEVRARSADAGSGAALGLAALTRPEGVFLFGLLELADLGRAVVGGERARWLRGLPWRAVPFLVPFGAHLAWRRATYGEWVPNTFHAKVAHGGTVLEDGISYVVDCAAYFGPVFVLLPFALALFGRGGRAWIPCLVVAAAYPSYVALAGGDFKPTSRMVLPVMPLWSALAAASFARLAALVGRRGGALALGGVLVALIVQSTWWELGDNASFPDRRARVRQLTAVGRHLDEVLPAEAWIAVSNAGAIPYYADRRTIDMLGLNDAHIARTEPGPLASSMPGHRKGDGAYVLAREPDVILFIALEVTPDPLEGRPDAEELLVQRAFGTSEKEIAASPERRRHYRLVSAELPDGIGWVNYLRRRGTGGSR